RRSDGSQFHFCRWLYPLRCQMADGGMEYHGDMDAFYDRTGICLAAFIFFMVIGENPPTGRIGYKRKNSAIADGQRKPPSFFKNIWNGYRDRYRYLCIPDDNKRYP